MKKELTVLIVEDSFISAEYLRRILEDENYRIVDIVDTGHKAIEVAHQLKPDIVLMDIMLKDNISGTEAAVRIHRDTPDCKIIFLTAYADEEMIDYADESEAYGYLLKPYREKEILATIRLAFSHQEKKTVSSEIIKLISGYSFNTKLSRLYKDDHEILLSKNALKFIEVLAKNRNTTVSNEQICYHVWGEAKSDNTIRALVHRIRDVIDSNLIHNIKGIGYMISS
jgi:DNA-binding response OmpR family regulator